MLSVYLGGNLRWLPLIYQGQLRPHARYLIQPSPGQFWIPHCGRCGHTATVFQAMEVRISCQWNLDSRFQSFAGSLITQAGLQIPKPRTLDPTSRNQKKKFILDSTSKDSRFRNPEYKTRGNQLTVVG